MHSRKPSSKEQVQKTRPLDSKNYDVTRIERVRNWCQDKQIDKGTEVVNTAAPEAA